MAAVTIRNSSHETHRAVKVRATRHDRSAEAEMPAILDAAARPEGRLRLGAALAERSHKIGLANADVEALEPTAAPSRPNPYGSATPRNKGSPLSTVMA